MKTKFKPNTRLPKGGKLLLKPIRGDIGSWLAMEYDSEVFRNGLTWLRVKDGFGGRNDREDWVGKVSSGCLSVSDYNWQDTGFGTNYGSFDKAIKAKCKSLFDSLKNDEQAALKKLQSIRKTIKLLRP